MEEVEEVEEVDVEVVDELDSDNALLFPFFSWWYCEVLFVLPLPPLVWLSLVGELSSSRAIGIDTAREVMVHAVGACTSMTG